MRLSLLCSAVIATPILLIVGCSATPQPAVSDAITTGTVTSKEYEPAKTKTSCPKAQKNKRLRCKTVTVKKACYEVEIRVDRTGNELELCDRTVFNALSEGDRYSSAIDYSTVNR